MNFTTIRPDLADRHAIFAPSTPYWLGYSDDQIMKLYVSSYAASTGTILHDIARKYIKHGKKMPKTGKQSVIVDLLDQGIPQLVLDNMPAGDIWWANLVNYVNDSVSFKMTPEVQLYYSDFFFGKTDAICFDEQTGFLRIHDLKNGVQPAKMEQLMIYEALFVLQWGSIMGFTVGDINSELRIYQGGEIIFHNPGPTDILPIMDRMTTVTKALTAMQERRG